MYTRPLFWLMATSAVTTPLFTAFASGMRCTTWVDSSSTVTWSVPA
jgi:hypothetical protein